MGVWRRRWWRPFAVCTLHSIIAHNPPRCSSSSQLCRQWRHHHRCSCTHTRAHPPRCTNRLLLLLLHHHQHQNTITTFRCSNLLTPSCSFLLHPHLPPIPSACLRSEIKSSPFLVFASNRAKQNQSGVGGGRGVGNCRWRRFVRVRDDKFFCCCLLRFNPLKNE